MGLIFLALTIIACQMEQDQAIEVESMKFKLTSTAFEHEGTIPTEYTCDGPGISPPLAIEGAPSKTKAFALVCDDPDAPVGNWDHWVVFNIPPGTVAIAAGTEPEGIPGRNSWGSTGYGGPCPPSGTHRYYFKLFALDSPLDLEGGASKGEVERAMIGHVLAKAELMGQYSRE